MFLKEYLSIEQQAELMKKVIVNTPWNAVFDYIDAKGVDSKHLINYYLLVVLGQNTDNRQNFISLDKVPSVDIKLANAKHFGMMNIENAEYAGMTREGCIEITENFVSMIRDSMTGIAKTINGFNDDTILDDKNKYRRHYAGKPQEGVTLHKCACCGQLFFTTDTLVDGETEKYECVVSTVLLGGSTAPICPYCEHEIIELASDTSKYTVSDFIKMAMGMSGTKFPVTHVSIAPPDNEPYEVPIHKFFPMLSKLRRPSVITKEDEEAPEDNYSSI